MLHSERSPSGQAAVLFVGDGSPGWLELVRDLGAQLPVAPLERLPDALTRMIPASGAGTPCLLADDAAMPSLTNWLSVDPSARVIFIAAEPGLVLSESLDAPAEDCLGVWRARVQNGLRLAHAHPTRCVFVDVEEGLSHRPAAAQALQSWISGQAVSPVVPDSLAAPRGNLLGRWLASGVVATMPETALLAAEVSASSLPLTAPVEALPGPTARERLGHWQAQQRSLAEAAARIDSLLAEREALLSAALTRDAAQVLLQQELVAAQQAHETALDEGAELRSRLADTSARIDSLLAEREDLLSAALSRETAQAQLQQELAAAQRAHEARQIELAELRTRLAEASDRIGSLLAEREEVLSQDYRLRDEVDRLTASDSQLQRAGSSLAEQLTQERQQREQAELLARQLQSELERMQDATRRQDELAALLARREENLANLRTGLLRSESERESAVSQLYDAREAATSALEQVDRYLERPPERPRHVGHVDLRLQGTRDEAPYREARFLLTQVEGPTGLWPELEVRLVEHHGHPGLVLFGTPESGILGQWRVDGEEDGRPFMLILPDSPEQLPGLLQMGCSDWRFVCNLVEQLRQSLRSDDPGSPGWLRIASRLKLQLQALPSRLRFDRLQVCAAADEPQGQVLDVCFSPWSHGQRADSALRLRWRPGSGRGADPGRCTLSWQLPVEPGAAPALAGWPIDAGVPVDPLPLPVGAGWSAVDRRGAWARLPDADRDLVLAVLDALQGVGEQLPAELQSRKDALRSQAQSLHRQAREDLRGLAWRGLARRWAGRRAH